MKNKLNIEIQQFERLNTVLNFQISTPIIYAALLFPSNIFSFLAPAMIVLFIAVIFSIYMLYIFGKSKKYSWIITFTICISLPFLILLFTDTKIMIPVYISTIIAYIYFFIIKYMVSEMIKEYHWAKQLAREKTEREIRQKEELESIHNLI